MECGQFEELIIEYLDCGMTRPMRRQFCEHLLACRPCHILFNDVRESIDACRQLSIATESARESQLQGIGLYTGVEQRIIKATTAGEMLSCRALDAIISDYFDGIIESSYEKVFNEHFAVCEGCRQLVDGVRQSIEELETVEMPDDLYDRILAATVGTRR